MPPAKIITPGMPVGPAGGIRQVYDLRPGQGANILIGEEDPVVYYQDLAIRVIEPGPYILLPLELWSRTLSRAVANNEDEPTAVPLTRQARRSAARKRPN